MQQGSYNAKQKNCRTFLHGSSGILFAVSCFDRFSDDQFFKLVDAGIPYVAFDRIIDLDRLCASRLNDSKNPMRSRKDRHEKIGEGSLGLDAIVRIINHPQLRTLPFYLETPNEIDGYAREIALLRGAYKE